LKVKKNALSFLLPFFLIFVLFFLYIKTLSLNFNFDGVVYALFLRNSIITKSPFSFLHYQHLVYQPLSYFFYKTLKTNLDPLIFLEFESLFFSILSLILFYLTIKKITKDFIFSSISILFLGFSHIFWYYSVEAEVHSLSFLLVALSLYIISIKECNSISSLFAGLPILSHVLNTFYLISYGLLKIIKKEKELLKQFLILISIPSLSYLLLLFYLKSKGNLASFFSKRSAASLSLPSLKALFQNMESFGKFFSLGLISYLFAILFWVFILYILIKKRKDKFDFILLYWVLFAFLFHLFWEPFNPELKAPLLILFLLVFLKEVYKIKRWKNFILSISIILLFSLNFGFFKSNADDNKNINYKIAISIKKCTPKNSIIIIGGTKKGYVFGKAYIPYFSLREAISLDTYGKKINKIDVKAIFEKIRIFQEKKKVFILNDYLDSKVSKELFSSRNSYKLFKGKLSSHLKFICNLGQYKLYYIKSN